MELYLNWNCTLFKIQIFKTLTSQEYHVLSSGDPLQFQSFWEIFDSSIHWNTSLVPINKFSYLKTLLTGKAKDVLNSLEVTSGNYEEAAVILKSHFGDPQVVIQSNIDILLALHPVSSSSSSSNITGLCKTYDKVETVSRNVLKFTQDILVQF